MGLLAKLTKALAGPPEDTFDRGLPSPDPPPLPPIPHSSFMDPYPSDLPPIPLSSFLDDESMVYYSSYTA
jgi:hypothetical protein